ncbi:hypothetical protein HK105_200553 [Polyrhizophydium stewartii]|uniref:Uncharacterized protein n=1 Tax=Polyrhizophydium stewartii TaxID=2732419 RepID=A0ABR4NJL6_9FUNG
MGKPIDLEPGDVFGAGVRQLPAAVAALTGLRSIGSDTGAGLGGMGGAAASVGIGGAASLAAAPGIAMGFRQHPELADDLSDILSQAASPRTDSGGRPTYSEAAARGMAAFLADADRCPPSEHPRRWLMLLELRCRTPTRGAAADATGEPPAAGLGSLGGIGGAGDRGAAGGSRLSMSPFLEGLRYGMGDSAPSPSARSGRDAASATRMNMSVDELEQLVIRQLRPRAFNLLIGSTLSSRGRYYPSALEDSADAGPDVPSLSIEDVMERLRRQLRNSSTQLDQSSDDRAHRRRRAAMASIPVRQDRAAADPSQARQPVFRSTEATPLRAGLNLASASSATVRPTPGARAAATQRSGALSPTPTQPRPAVQPSAPARTAAASSPTPPAFDASAVLFDSGYMQFDPMQSTLAGTVIDLVMGDHQATQHSDSATLSSFTSLPAWHPPLPSSEPTNILANTFLRWNMARRLGQPEPPLQMSGSAFDGSRGVPHISSAALFGPAQHASAEIGAGRSAWNAQALAAASVGIDAMPPSAGATSLLSSRLDRLRVEAQIMTQPGGSVRATPRGGPAETLAWPEPEMPAPGPEPQRPQ